MITLSNFLIKKKQPINESFLVPELNILNKDLKEYNVKFNTLNISHSVHYDKLTPNEVKLVPVEEKTYKEIFSLRKNCLSSVFFKMQDGKYNYLYVPCLSKLYELNHNDNYYNILQYNNLAKNSSALLSYFKQNDEHPKYALIINPDKQSEIDFNRLRSDRKIARSNFIPKTDDEIKKYFDDNFYAMYNDKSLEQQYYSVLASQNNEKYKAIIAKNMIKNGSKVAKYKDILSKIIKEINTLSANVLIDDDLQGKTSSIIELLEHERSMISYLADICMYENIIKERGTDEVNKYTQLLKHSYKQLDIYINRCEDIIKKI